MNTHETAIIRTKFGKYARNKEIHFKLKRDRGAHQFIVSVESALLLLIGLAKRKKQEVRPLASPLPYAFN